MDGCHDHLAQFGRLERAALRQLILPHDHVVPTHAHASAIPHQLIFRERAAADRRGTRPGGGERQAEPLQDR